MNLNVGCGEHYAAAWTNIDLHRDGPTPDIACSILDMPFGDGACERVYCGHVLEHIALAEMPRALAEVRRVLAPAGDLIIVGPDIALTRLHEPTLIDGVVNGGRRWPGDEHQWTASGDKTLCHLLAAGFDAYLTSLADLSAVWPVLDRAAAWQFAIAARHRPGLSH